MLRYLAGFLGQASVPRPGRVRPVVEILEDRRVLTPWNLTTGAADGGVDLGVDGYGAFGSSIGADASEAFYNPIGAIGVIPTIYESGLAIRIGNAGPRSFMISGNIGGSGGLVNPVVTGDTTTANSSWVHASGLSFSLVQTIAPNFNGPTQTGSILTQTYTITNPTAASIDFELVRFVDTQRNVYAGGHFFDAAGTEYLYATELGNNFSVGFTGVGGTPLATDRYEIVNFPSASANILAGTAMSGVIFNDANGDDLIDPTSPFNWNIGLRNAFTLAAGARTTYTAQTIWGLSIIGTRLAPAVTEGGATDIYSVWLTGPTQSNVNVTVNPDSQVTAAPLTRTFTSANWDTPQDITVTAVDDVLNEGAHTGTLSHTSTSADGRFNASIIATVTASITDNDNFSAIISPTTLNVFEGGATGTYTVVLNGAPTANVVVSLNAGTQLSTSGNLTFTSADWNVPQTVTVTAVDDTIIEGDQTDTISHTVTSGDTNFNGITLADVTATVTDNDPGRLVSFQTFTVNGDYVAAGTTIRGLTSANITIAGIPAGSTVTAAYLYWNFQGPDELAALRSLSFNGTPLSGTIIGSGLLNTQNSYSYRAAVTSFVTGNGVYALGGIHTGGAYLGNSASLVVVYTNPLDPSRTIVLYDGTSLFSPLYTLPTTNTFTGFTAPARVNAKTTFIVAAGDPGSENVSFTGGLGSTNFDGSFNGSDGSKADTDTYNVSAYVAPGDTSVSATVGFTLDDEVWIAQVFSIGAPGVNMTPTGGSTDIAEGGAFDTYNVVLANQPSANVVITIAPDAQLSASTTTLTFTTANWNSPQTVTVSAIDDASTEGSHAGVITHTVTSTDIGYNGLPLSSLTASIVDNDNAGISIVPSGGLTNVTEGGTTDTYTVVLNTLPAANVIITLSPDSQVNVSSTRLTFTLANWNLAQTVTVTAVDDAVAEGLHSGVIGHTSSSTDTNYNNLTIANLTATIADNDNAGVTLNPTTLVLAEGAAGTTYTVTLASQPTANVIVSLLPDTQVALSTASLTFTPANWNSPRTVTVTAVNDLVVEGTHSGIIAATAGSSDLSYNGVAVADVTATITDNDFPGITLSTASLSVLEGATQIYSAVLDLPPTADVVLNFTPGTLLAVAPGTLTFTPANWNLPQAIVVTAIDDALVQGNHSDTISHSVSSSDAAYNALAVPQVTANILDNEGTLILGTVRADKIVVTNSADLSRINVSLNGTVTSYTSSISQLVISADAGTDDIQLFNPQVPVVVIGGQHGDKVLVTGQSSANAFTLDNAALTINGVSVGLFEVENVIASGNSGDDTFSVLNTPTFSAELRGNLGIDQITGSDRANTWKIVNPNAGTLNNNIRFTAVENLLGGSSTDGFYFNAGKKITGTIDGAGGTNELNYSGYTTPVTVNLQIGLATSLASFQSIDRVVGGKASDRLIGLDQTNLWNVTDLNAGDVGGVTFQGIENLVGGQLDDTFRLADNRGLKGKIDGAGGNNILDYGSYLSRAAILNLQLHTATNLAGFVNIGQFVGGAGTDTLIAANLSNTWNVTASNSGDVNGFTFTGFENLTGGAKSDAFTIGAAGAWSGLLQGGTGSDALTSSGGTYVITGLGSGLLDGRKFQSIERHS